MTLSASGPAKAGLHQLVQPLDDSGRLIAGIDATLDQVEQRLAHPLGDIHLARDHQAGNVLSGIRNIVLQIQHLEQVTPIHRHEKALRQMRAKLVLDFVGLVLEREDPLLDGLDLLLVAIAKRFEQFGDLRRTLLHRTHMLLHRFERRTSEQTCKCATSSHGPALPNRCWLVLGVILHQDFLFFF